ncbi:putative protease [Kineothrix alysoides]|uniref:Putative protease n=1 Tax=Kineothrix alysoides TaxID=1469948 RepID=A0A4R1QZP5_9FIRM|nr:U32 family peptidase [Kineothrix alysoides]TCL58470.1 putative protease [Kineothrix alysoides]
MKKVELLAPAGNYECFLGAVHAGADAVYLGGNKFGARAYADNFSEEEVINAIRHAHIYGRKVYLTLNTLVKESEFAEIYDYLQPFYQAGLDGIIIQDMGAFRSVGEWFPRLERHISTQMTITGAYGAEYIKRLGATRIVPARELSLAEIKNIKKEVDIEIEIFVHGAVCYCYSGQCLFSSIIGGRSGNRGRCAQPCRLPYSAEGKKEKYPLSLKDMCTIALIPELIEAGIDSFKIEGRMKSPEYVAGVTALYRKYIDKYYDSRGAGYSVKKEDMEALRSLYIRSEISEGYYHKHNGKDMITLDNPSYGGRDESLSQRVREEYLQGDYRLDVTGKTRLYKNSPAYFALTYKNMTAAIYGNIVEEALKQPMSEESVRKQLAKSGNTAFHLENIEIDMESDIFIPVKALNDLRRMACEALAEKIITFNGLSYPERKETAAENPNNEKLKAAGEEIKPCRDKKAEKSDRTVSKPINEIKLHVSVQTEEQLSAALENSISRIYISSDLLEASGSTECTLRNNKKDIKFYLAMPHIIRDYDKMFLDKMKKLLEGEQFSGVLIRNQEELQWLRSFFYSKDIVTDANLYMWNKEAYEVYKDECAERYLPHELNFKEIAGLMEAVGSDSLSQIVYGRIPMMVTANCVSKTMGFCRKTGGNKNAVSGTTFLTDRYRKNFPVYLNCRHCYNIIYNSVPLSLHQNLLKMRKLGVSTFRLDFTTEKEKDAGEIISFYESRIRNSGKEEGKPPFAEYTNAHLNRGVE